MVRWKCDSKSVIHASCFLYKNSFLIYFIKHATVSSSTILYRDSWPSFCSAFFMYCTYHSLWNLISTARKLYFSQSLSILSSFAAVAGAQIDYCTMYCPVSFGFRSQETNGFYSCIYWFYHIWYFFWQEDILSITYFIWQSAYIILHLLWLKNTKIGYPELNQVFSIKSIWKITTRLEIIT